MVIISLPFAMKTCIEGLDGCGNVHFSSVHLDDSFTIEDFLSVYFFGHCLSWGILFHDAMNVPEANVPGAGCLSKSLFSLFFNQVI